MSTPSTDWEKWKQERRRERQERGLRLSGACLMCDRETPYGDGDHYGYYGRGGNAWLDKQFAEPLRSRHVEVFTEGVGFERVTNNLFDQFVCSACKTQARKMWPVKQAERQALWEQNRIEQEKQRAEYQFQSTWRKPERDEFEIASNRREFKARSLDRRPATIVFRWRTCTSKECRGSVPAQRVGMWVNGRLRAHYYGWELKDERVDLFGAGLAYWIEDTFQRDLARLEPAAIWHAKGGRPSARRTEDNWDGLSALHICNYGQGQQDPEPCVIHTVWHNGSVYAQLRNFYRLSEVVEFAWESLHVDIRSVE